MYRYNTYHLPIYIVPTSAHLASHLRLRLREVARQAFPRHPTPSCASVGTVITLLPGETKYIAVDGGATGNSANTSASGVLWFAWGHKTAAGTDLDHSYTPSPWPVAPATTTTPPYGEGWTGRSFSIAATPRRATRRTTASRRQRQRRRPRQFRPPLRPPRRRQTDTAGRRPCRQTPLQTTPLLQSPEDAPATDAPLVTDAPLEAAAEPVVGLS